MFKKIIVHPAKDIGEAHFDDTIAIALILGFLAKIGSARIPVVRKNPSIEELNNSEIAVIDVGGDYNPDLNNFDHHQDNTLDASYVLVGKKLGIDEKCEKYFPWWKPMSILDARGPFELADQLGTSSSVLSALQNPLGEYVVATTVAKNDELSEGIISYLENFGKFLWSSLEIYDNDMKLLETDSTFKTVGDLKVLIFPHCVSATAIGLFRRDKQFDISITMNARNNSLSIYRYEDIKGKIDLNRMDGQPNVLFVHKNGFLLVTSPQTTVDEALELINRSVI